MNTNQGDDMNENELTTAQQEELQKQAALEDAIRWGVFSGEEPTPEQMEHAKASAPLLRAMKEHALVIGPTGSTKTFRALPETVRALLAEQVRDNIIYIRLDADGPEPAKPEEGDQS